MGIPRIWQLPEDARSLSHPGRHSMAKTGDQAMAAGVSNTIMRGLQPGFPQTPPAYRHSSALLLRYCHAIWNRCFQFRLDNAFGGDPSLDLLHLFERLPERSGQ